MDETGAVIYTGPGSVRLGLRHNTVYRDGLPEYISAMTEKYELASKFFVSVEDYAQGIGVYAQSSEEWQNMIVLLNDIARKEA